MIVLASLCFSQSVGNSAINQNSISRAEIEQLIVLRNGLSNSKTSHAKLHLVNSSPISKQIPRLKYLKGKCDNAGKANLDSRLKDFTNAVSSYIAFYGSPQDNQGTSSQTLKQEASAIKKDNDYRDPQSGQTSNWFQKFLDKLRINWPSPKDPDLNLPNLKAPRLQISTIVVWVILIALILAFAVWATLSFRKTRKTKLGKKTMLDENEEGISKSEWLVRAEKYEQEGAYREAVRCYYIATLLRFDEAKIARFEPNETNWDHLKRIEKSRLKPTQLEFGPPTYLFDNVWYGFKVNGSIDAEKMRNTYQEVDQALRNPVANNASSDGAIAS